MASDLGDKLLRPEPGILEFDGSRQILLQPQTVSEIQKGVEDRLGPKASEYLYAAGSVWSISEIRKFRKDSSAPNVEPTVWAEIFCQNATTLGWGQWRLVECNDEHKQLTVVVQHSPLAQAYGQADLPVCHLISGAVAGLAEALFHLPTSCTEQACLVQGAPACRFVAVGTDLAASDGWEW